MSHRVVLEVRFSSVIWVPHCWEGGSLIYKHNFHCIHTLFGMIETFYFKVMDTQSDCVGGQMFSYGEFLSIYNFPQFAIHSWNQFFVGSNTFPCPFPTQLTHPLEKCASHNTAKIIISTYVPCFTKMSNIMSF